MPYNMKYQLYTDGGCRGNPGIGAWGFHLIDPNQRIYERSNAEKYTTNNKMELTAVIEGLMNIPESNNVVIYTDSTYVKNGIQSWIKNWKRNGWKTRHQTPVKNQKYWRALDDLTQKYNIEWVWVKGHSNNKGNERADTLCNIAMNKLTQKLRPTKNILENVKTNQISSESKSEITINID